VFISTGFDKKSSSGLTQMNLFLRCCVYFIRVEKNPMMTFFEEKKQTHTHNDLYILFFVFNQRNARWLFLLYI